MIPVSQPFLPPINEYTQLISSLWETKWLTNNGEFVQKLESELKEQLGVNSLFFVSNGTIALQLALRALKIKNEVITTPFSFVATTTSIIWEDCQPIFVDIDPDSLCIDVNKIEEAITEKTEAILATHVYGIPCNVREIENIANKYNLTVIYDAAHAFGINYNGKSIMSYGDISTISFHSTKLFHTVEGGALINNRGKSIDKNIDMLRNFGVKESNYELPGINGKNSEFHAAMGLINIPYIDYIINSRKRLSELYDSFLTPYIKKPFLPEGVEYNYAYYPIILPNEQVLIKVKETLEKNNIQTRRYFFPSLNKLSYLTKQYSCEVSEDISKRVLCLPLYSELEANIVQNISNLIIDCLREKKK